MSLKLPYGGRRDGSYKKILVSRFSLSTHPSLISCDQFSTNEHDLTGYLKRGLNPLLSLSSSSFLVSSLPLIFSLYFPPGVQTPNYFNDC